MLVAPRSRDGVEPLAWGGWQLWGKVTLAIPYMAEAGPHVPADIHTRSERVALLMCSLTWKVPDGGSVLERVLAGGICPLLAHGMPLYRT